MPVFGLFFRILVQLLLDDGPEVLDATKAFQDLAERYVRSNDANQVEALEEPARSDCLTKIRLREPDKSLSQQRVQLGQPK